MYDIFIFFKQKTAYEMRMSDRSSDVCSSDLGFRLNAAPKTHVDLFVDGRHVVADAASGDLRTGQRSAMERDGTIIVTQAGQSWFFSQTPPVKAGGAAASDGAILPPMPGRIIAVAVAKGDRVAKGQQLEIGRAPGGERGCKA